MAASSLDCDEGHDGEDPYDTRDNALGEVAPDGCVGDRPESGRDEQAPGMSSVRVPAALVSGTWRTVIPAVSRARGTLTRKMVRQLTASMSHPPRKAPTALVAPANPDQSPSAFGRSSGWMVVPMMDMLPGTRSAPPTPCEARNAMSHGVVGATLQASEAPEKRKRPMTKSVDVRTRLRDFLPGARVRKG